MFDLSKEPILKTIQYTIIAFILLTIAMPAIYAHHLWIESSNDQYAVIRGIVPDRIDPYDPDCIREIGAFGKDGEPIDIERLDSQDQVRFIAGKRIAMATTWSEWGYRVNTTRGKRLITRAEAEEDGLQVLSAFFSTHYAKSLLEPLDIAGQPAGLRFEIVPLGNPVNKEPGSEVEFLVLFDGQPLAETTLYTEGGNESVTDENGRAIVTVPDTNTALLYARHRIDITGDDKKDYDIFTTFLTFGVKK